MLKIWTGQGVKLDIGELKKMPSAARREKLDRGFNSFDSKHMEIYTTFDLNQNKIPRLSPTVHQE